MKFRIDKGTGYMYSYALEHPCANSCGKVSEHVYVMSNSIGRLLTKDECVHHKDLNKTNNELSNLQLMTRSAHAQFHQLENMLERKEIACRICGKLEIVPITSMRIYCSISCKNLDAYKVSFIKEELAKLVWEIPMTKIGKIYGVSDVTVRKHCKHFRISTPPTGYFLKKKKMFKKSGFLF